MVPFLLERLIEEVIATLSFGCIKIFFDVCFYLEVFSSGVLKVDFSVG
jgi:hypothetical protein